tara:strand:+ start:108 stop:668 length:561 start_codon:yes stop_codon:yes gene_type:complete
MTHEGMMPAGRAKDLGSLADMSDVSDIAQWCVGRGHREVMLHTRRPNLVHALREAGIEITDGPASLVLWLDDAIGDSLPWSHVITDGEVVVEGCLPLSRGVHAIAVETDRAVIVTSDGSECRRIEFIDGSVAAVPVHPVALETLDESARKSGFDLDDRWVDWSWEPTTPTDPCHLSLFRNVRKGTE